MNRREMLTGIAVASATVALTSPSIAKSLPASRAQWDAALTKFRRLHDEHEEACNAHSAFEDRYCGSACKKDPVRPHVRLRLGAPVS